MNEIDNRSRMVKIVQRLPLQLQNRWRKDAVRQREESGVYPNIEALVKFIERVAKELNDPVFGTTKGDIGTSKTDTKSKPKKSGSFGVKSLCLLSQ